MRDLTIYVFRDGRLSGNAAMGASPARKRIALRNPSPEPSALVSTAR